MFFKAWNTAKGENIKMKDKPITFGSLTRTAYLFSSALFSLANTLQISPLEKKYPLCCTLAYGSGETRVTYQTKKKKKKKIREHTRARMTGVWVEWRGWERRFCDNGPHYYLLIFTSAAATVYVRRDRMLNNIETFYKRPRAAFYRPRPELEKCLCGSASTPPRNSVFQKYRRFRFLLARKRGGGKRGGPRVRKGIVGKKDNVPRVTQNSI